MAVRITRKNAIDLFEAIAANAWDVAKIYEADGNKEMAERLKQESFAYTDAAETLRRPKHFAKRWEIFEERITNARKQEQENAEFLRRIDEEIAQPETEGKN